MRASVAFCAALAVSQASAFWRLPCTAPVIVERIDPIVSPGKVSGHVHTRVASSASPRRLPDALNNRISGGSGVSPSATFDTLRASSCTSCLVQQDLSAYWTPSLYFQWANGSFTSVPQVGGGLIYYLPRNNSLDTGPVLAFPDGLKILIGNPSLRSYDPTSLMAQAIGWNCLGQASSPTRNPFLPPNDCPNGLRGELRFPSCWDGVNTDSTDHFSHMAYSDGESGPCPSTHPKRIVTLFYEMMWDVNSKFAQIRGQGLNATQPFVLATGDPTGYRYHADFLDGWDKTVLQNAINTCTSASGVIQECPVFNLYPDNAQCHKTPDVNEIVLGTLPSLPGCNPTFYGPASATSCSAPSTPAFFSNPVSYTGGAPPPGSQVTADQPAVLTSYGSWKYNDCYSDNVGNVRALPNGLSNPAQTASGCLDACTTAGYAICGVEYHGECWGGNTLASSSTAIGYGSCSFVCNGNSTQYCGGSNALDLYTKAQASRYLGFVRGCLLFSTLETDQGISNRTYQSSCQMSSKLTSAMLQKVLSTSTTASSSRTTTPSASAALVGKVAYNKAWSYVGCNSDLINNGRSLPNTFSSNGTVDGCLAACQTAGFAICGLSYHGECYGGAAISTASTALPASSCQSACSSDPSQTCGGSGSLDVYKSTKVRPLTTPTTPNLASAGGWGFSACYSDLTGPNRVRTLPIGLSNSNQTIEGCLTSCSTSGATICGLSYSGECYGSTTGIASTSAVIAATSCQMACKGNPLEWCGGNAAVSVYLPLRTKRDSPARVHLSL